MQLMDTSKPSELSIKVFIGLLWVFSVIISGIIGFSYGQGSKSDDPTNVLSANISPIPVTAAPSPQITPTPTSNSILGVVSDTPTPTVNPISCSKTGFAQKWEYLTAYEVKQGDTIQNIAKEQLKDETRVNEILQINGVGLVIGSTLYLPPPSITKSSGNIKQVYGKLLEKNNTSWHIGFSNDPKGQGILIPSFWFEGISNKDSYKTGDCLKVFFDEGFKVYTVALQ